MAYKKKIIEETLSDNTTQYRVKEGYVFFNKFEYGWIDCSVHWSKMERFKTKEPSAAVFNTLEEAEMFCKSCISPVCINKKIIKEYE